VLLHPQERHARTAPTMKTRPFLFVAILMLPVCSHAQEDSAQAANPPSGAYQTASGIVLPKVDFREATIREAVEFLRLRSKTLDPLGKGVNILVKGDEPKAPAGAPVRAIPGIPGLPERGALPAPAPGEQAPDAPTRTSLTLNQVPLPEALKYLASSANYQIRWDEHAVVLIAPEHGKAAPPAEPRPELNMAAGVPKAILEKLQQITLPKVQFAHSTPRDAFDFLMQRARALDPDGAGIPIAVKGDRPDGLRPDDAQFLTFTAENLSLIEILRYVAELSGNELVIEPAGIFIGPKKK
jgi:hypothetical protein